VGVGAEPAGAASALEIAPPGIRLAPVKHLAISTIMLSRPSVVAAASLALLSLLRPSSAGAEICTIDPVPAATLLIPYFAVDLDACESPGTATSFTVNNAAASATIAHIVVWTDWSVPALDFDVFLTGFDVQAIDLKAVLCRGEIPATGVSSSVTLDALTREHLRAWLTGNQSSLFGNCAGFPRGNNVAVGYVTVDNYTSAIRGSAADGPAYVAGLSAENQLWGSWSLETVATRQEAVPCESCSGLKGRKKRKCRRQQRRCADAPQTTTVTVTNRSTAPAVPIEAAPAGFFVPADRTFYGRYIANSGADRREPLGTTFGVEYARVAAPADYGLVVWREATSDATGVACGARPPWFPLLSTQIVAFDDQENPAEIVRLLPNETQHVEDFLDNVPFDTGWLFLNLSRPAPSVELGQAWVTILRDGRIEQAGVLQFDTGCGGTPPTL